MKFKNIEDVWAYAKNKLVNAQISSIQRTGSSKFFDITIPKVMVKKDPKGLSTKRNLDYTISETAGEIECILEQTGDISTLYDTGDFFDAISGWCGINESQEMNQNAIIGIEDSDVNGYDKVIMFSYYSSRSELDKQLKKVGKPYMLSVLPSDEAEIHVKNSDVDKFKGVISALREKVETGMNMIMMEGITIKGRPLPDKFKNDFDNAEKSFIDSVIGTKWYQITPRSKVYKDAVNLMNKSKKTESKRLGWFTYDLYEAPKGTKFLYAYDGYGSDAFMFGDSNINESEAQDKYREFFENKLKQWNVSSPSELTQEDRSKFFTEIRNEWKSQKVNESHIVTIWDGTKIDLSNETEDSLNKEISNLKKAINVMNNNKSKMSKSLVASYEDLIKEINNELRSRMNESFSEGGYEILDQADFRNDFGSAGNFASYAMQIMYNPRLFVKCTSEHPNYGRIRAFAESLPEIPANEPKQAIQEIKCWRQTDSNIIITTADAVYWPYNTGTNLNLLNESELVKGLGKIFDTLSDVGKLSDNAVVASLKSLGGTMSELSTNPTTNSIKAYKVCEDTYQCLISELEKRGLRPVNR